MSNVSKPAVLSNGSIEYNYDSCLYIATSIYQVETAGFELLSDAATWLNRLEIAAKKKPKTTIFS